MPVTFEVPQGVFVDALNDALIGAGKTGVHVPIIECILLEGDKGAESITLTGTDRFILVQRVIQLDAPLADKVYAVIHRGQVEILAGVLKLSAAQRRQPPAPHTVTVGEYDLTARPGDRGGIKVPLDVAAGPYVRLGSLLDKREKATADVSLLAVNLGYLTRISKLSAAKARRGVAHFTFMEGRDGQPSMIFADFGDDGATRVIVMPARTAA